MRVWFFILYILSAPIRVVVALLRRPHKYRNPLLDYPRNMPCLCGSKKKFKVCHLNLTPKWVEKPDYIAAKRVVHIANSIKGGFNE